MIPGISPETEAHLLALLDPSVTDIDSSFLDHRDVTLLDARHEEARALGIDYDGAMPVTVVVTAPDRQLGNIRLQAGGANNVLFFDNAVWTGTLIATIRMPGAECLAMFCDIGDGYVAIADLLMRSTHQVLFWGRGATAVGISMEIEGVGRGIAIGDDALISNGVWIRNYDMHAVHDLVSGRQINRGPTNAVLERHVWLGQDALLLTCERIGMGTIVGARSLVKGEMPARIICAGTPAQVLREAMSWGRHPYGMTDDERRAVGLQPLAQPRPDIPTGQ